MTDDNKKILEELGVKEGDWQSLAGGLTSLDGVMGQGENLIKLRNILEGIVAADQKKLAALREQASRLKYGGGA